MPPFRYDPYDSSRWTGSIADILRLQGQIPADAAIRAGQIQADAARQQGQIWGNAVQGATQAVSSAITQANDPRRKLEAIALQDAQQRQAGQQRLDQLAAPVTPSGPLQDGEERTPQHPYLDDNGLWKIPELSQALASSGMAHMAPELLKGAEQINESITNAKRTQQAAAQATTISYGVMANSTLKLVKAGVPMEQALDQGAAAGLASQTLDPKVYAQAKARILSAPPDQQLAMLTGLMDTAAQLAPRKTLGKDAIETDIFDRTVASNAVTEPGKGDYTINGQRFKADGTAIGAVVPPQHTPVPKGLQSESEWQVGGKSTPVLFDPTTGNRYLSGEDYAANKPIDPKSLTKIPPASVQVQNLMGGSGGDASAAEKAIAEYKMAPPSPRSLATPGGKAMMDRILAYNPDYDATQFPTRSKMRAAFTSGPQGQTINSLNTAIEHLDQFVDVAKSLDNGKFQPGNAAYNWLKATFGDSAPTNFEGIRTIMSGELASAFKKSGATDQEISAVQSAIASKNSPAQLRDYATKIAIPALGSKVASFDQQFKQVMGANDPFKILLPNAEEVLKKYGFDPGNPKMGGVTGATNRPDLVRMKAPNGQVSTVPADQVDHFKGLGAVVVP